MRTKTRKWASPLFVLTLAIAGIFGVSAAVVDKQAEETPVVEKADAATNSVTLAGSFNSWSTTDDPLTLSGNYWTIQKDFAANDTFKIVVNGSDWVGDGDGVTWCDGMGSEGKGQNFKVLTAGRYVIKAVKTIGDYGDKSYGIVFEIGKYTVTKYRVASDTGTATSIGTESVNSGSLPTSPTLSGYRFYKWYSDSGCTTEVTSITSETPVYALMYKLGYYLVGNSTFTGSASTAWNIEGGVLATSTGGGNTAAWEGISIPVNSEFRMIYYESNGTLNYQNKDFTGNHVGFSGTPSSGGNIVCTAGGTYKVYFTEDYYIAINKDYTISYYEIKDGSTSSGNTATGNTDILLSTTLDGKFGTYSGYSIQGYYTTSSCDTSINLGTTYPTGATSVYAYYATDGFYMVGDATFKSQFGTTGKVYEVCSGVKMNAATGTNYAVYSFTVTATVTLKAYYYSSSGQHWVNHTQKSESATEHGVTFDGSGNYVIPSGTYSLYIFGTPGDESSSLTFGIPLDSYCTEFLSLTGPLCTGDTTNRAALLAAFNSLETDFGNMDPVDQATLTGTTAVIGGTDIQEVAARYDFVLRKYGYGTGTGVFHDFMTRTPSSRSAISGFSPFILNGNDSDGGGISTLIIIIASSISILSITALSVLMVKKKKEANK